MQILTKIDSYDLYHAGKFGNHLVFFESVDAVYNSGWDRDVALRTKVTPGIQLPNYCRPINVNQIEGTVSSWGVYGIQRKDVVANEIGPDFAITLQGEVMRSERYYDLRYTMYKDIMRSAFKYDNRNTNGYSAFQLLHKYMDRLSYDNLQRLFDLYPDSVVEFSCYAVDVGIQKLNTVFWEVRNY